MEFLDIIFTLRGTAMITDKEEDPESELETDRDEDVPEIQEVSTLDCFTATLQQAHDITCKVE